MEPASLIAVGSLLLSIVLGAFQAIKYVQELKDRKELATNNATKAEAERDTIVVKGAEGALLMMQGMLEVAKLSEGELRIRVRELENENREKERRLAELERKVREYEEQLHEEREAYALSQKLFEDRLLKQATLYEAKLSELLARTTALEEGNNDGQGPQTDSR